MHVRGGGTQLWVTHHVPPKRPYFFSLAFTQDLHFYQLSPNDPLYILTNSLSPKWPWHIFVTQRPLIFAFNSQTSDNFRQKIGLFDNFDKFDEMLRSFWPFWPWKPLLFDAFRWKTPYFCALCHWKTPFLTQFVTERSLHQRCLVALY